MTKALTTQRQLFAAAVAAGRTQSDAYREAFPASLKWQPKTVWAKASHLMAQPEIAARVKELQEQVIDRSMLMATNVLNELRKLVHSDISGIMWTEGKRAGQVKLPHELDAGTRAAVAAFKIDEYGRIEYKFWDKNSALEKAMKHLGLYERDNKQKTDPLTDLLKGLSGKVVGPGQTNQQGDDDEAEQ